MASAAEIGALIVEVSGVPESTIKTITRRLAEDGTVSRVSRGKLTPKMTPLDCANLSLGALCLSDGYNTVSNRIASRVREVGGLRFPRPCPVALGDSIEELDAALEIVQTGTFVASISNLIKLTTSGGHREQLSKIVQRIGVSFHGSGVCAWIDLFPGLEFVHSPESHSTKHRVSIERSFSGMRLSVSLGRATGMVREAYFTWDAIQRIADLGAADNTDWGT